MRAGSLFLDVQALQSAQHGDRGIGRYVFEFARTLCEAHPGLVGGLLLNPDLPAPVGVEALAATGKLGVPGEVDVSGGGIYHVASPFELDVAAERMWPSFAVESGMRLVVTLYDLIPEVFAPRYLADPGVRRRYRTRLELVRAADRVLAISEATRQDAVMRLGLDPGRVVNVGAGISRQFGRPADAEEAMAQARRALPRLQDSFILSVGGEEHRKNIEGLLAGYSALPPALRAAHQLVVACRMTDGYRDHLQVAARRLGIGPRLYLTGWVDDATLVALYQSTDLFVFPSLYEGYGLPVAEAMACGAPAVSSNRSAMAEIAAPAGQFDPTDPQSIAEAVGKALTDPATMAALRAASDAPPPTWAGVVARAVAAYDDLPALRSAAPLVPARQS